MANEELHTEGIQFLLEVAFTEEQSTPANFYIGLGEDASLAEDAGLAAVTELAVANNYARIAVASDSTDFTSAAAGAADYKVTTKEVTFTCTGAAWNEANVAFLASTVDDSGKLIASMPLTVGRTLQPTETLKITMIITITG